MTCLVNTFPFTGPSSVSFIDFVTEGWKRVNGEAPRTETVLKARELEIRPVLKNNTEVRLVLQRGAYYYHHPCYHLYQGIYNYVPATNHASRIYSVAAVLNL